MALPVMFGLPWLAGVIGGLFSGLFEFFAKYLTRRLAIVVAVLVAIAAMTVAFFAAFVGLMATIQVAMPAVVSQGLGIVLPPNFGLCLSVVMSSHVIRFAYEWNVRAARMKAQ